jgi:hypothetical protein
VKVTRWFSSDTKPARIGLYETRFDGDPVADRGFSHWDGSKWGDQYGRFEYAAQHSHRARGYQDKLWRGLASKPK